MSLGAGEIGSRTIGDGTGQSYPTVGGSGEVSGTATTDFGGLTSTSLGVRSSTGSAATVFGGLSATSAGDISRGGVATANLGGLSASAAAIPVGTASVDLGGLSATATGNVFSPVSGVAASTLGSLSATALGVVSAAGSGTAAATLGALTAAASGVGETPVETVLTSAVAVPLGGRVSSSNYVGVTNVFEWDQTNSDVVVRLVSADGVEVAPTAPTFEVVALGGEVIRSGAAATDGEDVSVPLVPEDFEGGNSRLLVKITSEGTTYPSDGYLHVVDVD